MLSLEEYKEIIFKLEDQLQKPVVNDNERTFFSMSVAAVLLDFTSAPKLVKEQEYQDAKAKYITEFKTQMN